MWADVASLAVLWSVCALVAARSPAARTNALAVAAAGLALVLLH